MNAMSNIVVDAGTPVSISDASTETNNGEQGSVNGNDFSVESPIVISSSGVLSIDESNLITPEQFALKQDALSSGANVTVNGATINGVDTVYTAGTGVSMTTDSSDSSKHTMSLNSATSTAFGGFKIDESSKNLKIVDDTLTLDIADNLTVSTDDTAREPYFVNNTAGYQPRVTKNGANYAIHAAIKWGETTGGTQPLVDIVNPGSANINSLGLVPYDMAGFDVSGPCYIKDGVVTRITSSSGNDRTPIHITGGLLTPWVSGSGFGSENKPIYISKGEVKESTANIGGKGIPIYRSATGVLYATKKGYRSFTYDVDGYNSVGNCSPKDYSSPMNLVASEMRDNNTTTFVCYGKGVHDAPTSYDPAEKNRYVHVTDPNNVPTVVIPADSMQVGKPYKFVINNREQWYSNYATPYIWIHTDMTNPLNGIRMRLHGFAKGNTYISLNETLNYWYLYDFDWSTPFHISVLSQPGEGDFNAYMPFVTATNGNAVKEWKLSQPLNADSSTPRCWCASCNGLYEVVDADVLIPLSGMTYDNTHPKTAEILNYIDVIRLPDTTNAAGTKKSINIQLLSWGRGN